MLVDHAEIAAGTSLTDLSHEGSEKALEHLDVPEPQGCLVQRRPKPLRVEASDGADGRPERLRRPHLDESYGGPAKRSDVLLQIVGGEARHQADPSSGVHERPQELETADIRFGVPALAGVAAVRRHGPVPRLPHADQRRGEARPARHSTDRKRAFRGHDTTYV